MTVRLKPQVSLRDKRNSESVFDPVSNKNKVFNKFLEMATAPEPKIPSLYSSNKQIESSAITSRILQQSQLQLAQRESQLPHTAKTEVPQPQPKYGASAARNLSQFTKLRE